MAVIRSGPVALAHGQILKPMTRLAVHQPAKWPVDVHHLPDAQNAVEIAPRCDRIEDRRAHHFRRHNTGQTAHKQRHQRNTNSEVRGGPLPPARRYAATPRSRAGSRGNADRILQVRVEEAWRHERHKHAAHGAAGRDSQVELRQIPRRGPGSGQFPMADHGEHEQRQRISRQMSQSRTFTRPNTMRAHAPAPRTPPATANTVRWYQRSPSKHSTKVSR